MGVACGRYQRPNRIKTVYPQQRGWECSLPGVESQRPSRVRRALWRRGRPGQGVGQGWSREGLLLRGQEDSSTIQRVGDQAD